MPSPLAPPFLWAVLGALLYARGMRRHARISSPRRRQRLRRQALAFWAGLITLVLALDSVVDDEAARRFWVHMLQHVLLMMVAAPLLVLAAPWTPIWRGLPLSTRRPLAAGYMRSPRWRAVRSAWRRVATPAAVWIAFNVNLALWHVPALYELTLRDQAIHDLEHLSFLLLAVLFWAQVIDSPPLRSRLDRPRQVAYVVLGATACWLLALVLAIAPSALYAGYAAGHGHAGGLSALSDQQLAAGIMLGPGSVPYALFVFVALYRWLALPTRDASPSLTPEQRSLQRDGARAAPGGSGAGAAARAIRS